MPDERETPLAAATRVIRLPLLSVGTRGAGIALEPHSGVSPRTASGTGMRTGAD